MAQEIFDSESLSTLEKAWEDLYKKDLLEAGSMMAHHHLRQINGSLYLEALLRRGLKRRENKETANPILEEVMMFTGMVGVEVIEDIANTNERVDALSLETLENVVKVHTNLNKVDRWVGEVDHQVEILEEFCQHYQEFLLVDQQCQVLYNREIQTLEVWCDRLVRMDVVLNRELGQYQDLVLVQTQTISAQNTFIWTLEAQVLELREMLMLRAGRTLGNPIVIKDDLVEVKEELRAGLSVVMTLIEIED